MAKLHNYYVLCPLIDQKSFLGVSKDKNDECVLVTLGRNVVNIYRLSDQKQVGGWTSKEHITSAVVYDQEQCSYVGVFNHNTIKTWKEDSDNLDKLKKYKFSLNILKIIPRHDQTSLVIFSNGNCASLPYAIDNRKSYDSKPLVKDSDVIVDTSHYSLHKTDHICYVIKNAKDKYEIVSCPLRDELGDLNKSKLSKVKITRPEDVYIVGVVACVMENSCVYILWSDSKLTTYNVVKKYWKTIGTVPWISTFSKVSLAWMGKNHLILFGSNVDQDGAIIVCYNIVLGIGSCRYPMKMYTEDSKLYCYNNRIILEASNHIGMLPYILETKRNLSSLLGSHEVVHDECTEIANWGSSISPMMYIGDALKEYIKQGLPERTICSEVIQPLLEQGDFRDILPTLIQFKDVPESVVVLLLKYTIKLVNPNNVDITNYDEFVKLCSDENKIHDTDVNRGKFNLLNYIFQIPFSDALLIPYLKNGLSLDDALFAIRYIVHLLIDSDKPVDMDYESKLFDWCMLLMDAFYQHYLMTKDEKVTFTLENMRNVVANLIDQLMVVDSTLPLLNVIYLGKPLDNEEESLSYTIELMNI